MTLPYAKLFKLISTYNVILCKVFLNLDFQYAVERKKISMKIFKPLSLLFSVLLAGCVGNMNPTGGNSAPNYPFFITTEPLMVKKIQVPVGTKLVYEESFFNEIWAIEKGSNTECLNKIQRHVLMWTASNIF